jgi:tight adherence protein C
MGLVIAALVTGIGIMILFRGLEATGSMADMVRLRLQAYREPDEVMDEELQLPLVARTVGPLWKRVHHFLGTRTPETRLAEIQTRLEMAGRPSHLTPTGFLVLRYVGAGVGLVGGGLLGAVLALGVLMAVLAAAGGAALGYFFPVLWLRQKAGDRKSAIARALPDAMDLITTVVEAGMAFDGALAEVATRFHNVLGGEFAVVLKETKLGRSRSEALEDMARRCGDDDIHNFVQAIQQSDQMGTPLSRVLKVQSGELRRVRRQRAQQKAGAAPVKMLLPMVGCIFPVIWIVLLGPAAMVLLKSFGH